MCVTWALASFVRRGQGTIVDSGTSFSYLPSSSFTKLKASITAACRVPGKCVGSTVHVPSESICYRLQQESDLATFPSVTVTLKPNAQVVLPPQAVFVHMDWDGAKAYCLSFYDNGMRGAVLGATAMLNQDVLFDKEAHHVGFAPSSCIDPGQSPTTPPGSDSTSASASSASVSPGRDASAAASSSSASPASSSASSAEASPSEGSPSSASGVASSASGVASSDSSDSDSSNSSASASVEDDSPSKDSDSPVGSASGVTASSDASAATSVASESGVTASASGTASGAGSAQQLDGTDTPGDVKHKGGADSNVEGESTSPSRDTGDTGDTSGMAQFEDGASSSRSPLSHLVGVLAHPHFTFGVTCGCVQA